MAYQPDRGVKSAILNPIPAQLQVGGYRWFTGSLAYVLHRVSGIALLFFLFFHIMTVTKGTNELWKYDMLMYRFQEPDFKIGEILLWGALLFHGLNGTRLMLIDFVLDRSHLAKPLFWGLAIATVVLLIIGAIPMAAHLFTEALNADSLGGGH